MMTSGRSGKIRVGVLFGGRSGEHEVSLRSAQSVLAALDPAKYEIIPIGITKDGRWITGDVMGALGGQHGYIAPAALLPDPTEPALMMLGKAVEAAAPSTSLSIISELDVVFPVLHGPYGEDGTVQGLLELAGLPFVGSGVVGSAVAMDKAIFKQIMVANGLPVLPWVLATRQQWQKDPDAVLDEVEAKLTYPVFSKPVNLGSSVGISKCVDRESLRHGLDEAARFDRRLVIEQGLENVRELEVAVLGNENPQASVVGEIRPRREFYDYIAKYLAEPGSDDDSELIIPAILDEQTAATVRKLAVKAYTAVDAAGLGRVDLFIDKNSGVIYLNELNTIPGFTSISMYPKLWEATGVSYPALLDKLIELALERHAEKFEMETSIDISSIQNHGEVAVS